MGVVGEKRTVLRSADVKLSKKWRNLYAGIGFLFKYTFCLNKNPVESMER